MAKFLKSSDEVAGEPIIAATMVSGPGTSTGGVDGGAIGSATRVVLKALDERRHEGRPRPSPLVENQPGYLAVTARRLLLMEIKIGVLSTRAAGVLAEVPRDEIATVDFPGGAAMIPLTVGFTDGTEWHFTVAKVYARNAKAVLAALTG